MPFWLHHFNEHYPITQLNTAKRRIRDNTLYIDTEYTDKIRYNDNLTVTKPLLKRQQLVRNYARILYLIPKGTYVLDIC